MLSSTKVLLTFHHNILITEKPGLQKTRAKLGCIHRTATHHRERFPIHSLVMAPALKVTK